MKDAEISWDSFCFYASVYSAFSSKIEGVEIELNSYIKNKKFSIKFLLDYNKKIDDLYNAYTFAQTNILNKENIAEEHVLLSKHINDQTSTRKITHPGFVCDFSRWKNLKCF